MDFGIDARLTHKVVVHGEGGSLSTQFSTLKVFEVGKEDPSNDHNIVRFAHIGNEAVYVLAEKPDNAYGTSPYLVYVLAYFDGQYATWGYNAYTKGFNFGNYYGGSYTSALKDFLLRGMMDSLLPKATESKDWKQLKENVLTTHAYWDKESDKHTSDSYEGGRAYGRWAALDDVKDLMEDTEKKYQPEPEDPDNIRETAGRE